MIANTVTGKTKQFSTRQDLQKVCVCALRGWDGGGTSVAKKLMEFHTEVEDEESKSFRRDLVFYYCCGSQLEPCDFAGYAAVPA